VEQARYQMGRIATHFVKSILAATEAQPAGLFEIWPELAAGVPICPMALSKVENDKREQLTFDATPSCDRSLFDNL